MVDKLNDPTLAALRRQVAFTPEEQARSSMIESSAANREELESEIARTRDPGHRAILSDAYAKLFGQGQDQGQDPTLLAAAGALRGMPGAQNVSYRLPQAAVPEMPDIRQLNDEWLNSPVPEAVAPATPGKNAAASTERAAPALDDFSPRSLNAGWDDQPAPSTESNFARGAKVAAGQMVPLAKGTVGLLGATAEKMLGPGGTATAVKDWGLRGYKEGMGKLEPMAKENDDVQVAWDKAKGGDYNALLEWASYGLGYSAAQVGAAIATGVAGGVVGTALAGPVGGAAGVIEGALASGTARGVLASYLQNKIAKESVRIAATEAGAKLTSDQLTKAAVKGVAKTIGQATALVGYAGVQEAGSIYSEAEAHAAETGKQLSAADLSRVWATSIGAAAIEGFTDMIGLGAITGKVRLPGAGGRVARGATGATIGATGEAGTEALQTVLERVGAGQSLNDDAAWKDYINSAALGALGGAPVGGVAGALHGRPRPAAAPEITTPATEPADQPAVAAAQGPALHEETHAVFAAPDIDSAITAASALATTNKHLESAVDQYLAPGQAPAADRQAELAAQAAGAGTEFERRNAQEQAQVALPAAAAGAATGYADLTPMTPLQAKQRLVVLRDQVAREGGNSLGLQIVSHPEQRGALAIAQRELPNLAELGPAAPTVAPAEAQHRIEASALAGSEQTRRESDQARQVVVTNALKAVEARGGVASPAEARIFQEANIGRPYDRIDTSLGAPNVTPEEQRAAAAGLVVERGPRERVTTTEEAQRAQQELAAEQAARIAAAQKQQAGQVKRAEQAGQTQRAEARLNAAEWRSTERAVTPEELQSSNRPTVVGEIMRQPLTKEAHGTLVQVARIFGKKIALFEGSGRDGFVSKNAPDTINLNIKASRPHMVIMMHEVAHQMKQQSPQAYALLERTVRAQLKSGAMEEFTKDYGPNADIEELVSDLVGNRGMEPDFWQSVFRPMDQVSVANLGFAIRSAIEKLKQVLMSTAGFKTDKLVKDLDAVKKAVAEAMRQYASERRGPAREMNAKEKVNAPHQVSEQSGRGQEHRNGSEGGAVARASDSDRAVSAEAGGRGQAVPAQAGQRGETAPGQGVAKPAAIEAPVAAFSPEEELAAAQDQIEKNSPRRKADPEKTVTAYKLFREKKGELFPLFIDSKTAVPVGAWLDADPVQTKGFAYRPGWHAGVLPTAPHLRNKEGKIAGDRVWAQVSMAADKDWQAEADAQPTRDIRGKIPTDGFYRFKTNKMQGGAWLIGGSLRVDKVLSSAEVVDILTKAGEHEAAKAEVRESAARAGEPIVTMRKDKTGHEYQVSVRREAFSIDKNEASIFVEVRDPKNGERRALTDFAIRKDGVLVAENAKTAPAYQKRGLAEMMYQAARDAGYDIAPGRVQTDQGLAMVQAFQKKGLINKEAEGPRFQAGNLDLQPIAGEKIPGEMAIRNSNARLADVPEYGKSTPGSISVYGVHYSTAARTTLSAAAAGTGLKGADNARIAAEGGIKNRVYFYVDKGSGVLPESGVGAYAHAVKLNNLYDADADPMHLAADNKGATAFERAVQKAGFTGYYRDSFRNDVGAAVLLGDHNVPTMLIGTGPQKPAGTTPERAAAPQLEGWRKAVADLNSSKRLPGGAVAGARWAALIKQFEPAVYAEMQPSGVFDNIADAGPLYKSDVSAAFKEASAVKESKPRKFDLPGLAKIEKHLLPEEREKLNRSTAQTLINRFNEMPPVDEFAAAAWAGRAKRGWYKQSAQAIAQVFGVDGPRFTALLASMSPQQSVQMNLLNALNTWKNWVAAGRPTDRHAIIDVMGRSVEGKRGKESVLGAWINNSVRSLSAEDPTEVILSGPKVDSFMRNLLGDVMQVTNDAWMANFALVNQKIFAGTLGKAGPGKRPGYLAMSASVRAAAARLTELTGEHWSPAEVQETVWSWAKTLYEAQTAETSARDILYNEELTDEMIRSTPDFKGLFHDDKYAAILTEAGYGPQLADLHPGAAGAEVTGARGQTAPFAAATQAKLLDKAAARLEKLREFGKPVDETNESTARVASLDDFHADVAGALQRPGWSVITGTQESKDARFNASANRRLARELRDKGIPFEPVEGFYNGADQGTSFLIIADQPTAMALGKAYTQESILTNEGLEYTDGSVVPAVHEDTLVGEAATKEPFYSRLPDGTAFSMGLDFSSKMEPAVQESTARQTTTPEFKAWFGNSAVVDPVTGEPRVMYHTTAADFNVFRPGSNDIGMHFGTQGQAEDRFKSLTDVKWIPEGYVPQPGEQEAYSTMPVYLKIENPLRTPDLGAWGVNRLQPELLRQFPEDADRINEFRRDSLPKIREFLAEKGYDGIVYFNRGETQGGAEMRARRDTAKTEAEQIQAAKEYSDFVTRQGEDSYIAFRPEQIKSATGNRGAFNLASPDIREATARTTPQPGSVWSVEAPGHMDEFVRTLQDRQVDLKRVVTAIKDQVGAIDAKFNPYLHEELYYGRTAKQTHDFLDFEAKPLIQDMAARGITLEQLETYLHNRHAEERNVQVAKINADMPDGGSGINTADARAYLAALTPRERTAFEALSKRVDDINRKTEALLVKSGLEKQETIDTWNATYKSYVPLQREEFESDVGQGTGQGFNVRGSSVKRAMGSEKEVANILANIMAARERSIVRAEKNRVSTAAYALAIKAPAKDFWMPFAPDRMKSEPQLARELVNMGLNANDVVNILAEPKTRIINPVSGLVEQRVNPLLRNAPNVLALRINGEDRYVVFNHRDDRANHVVRALKSLDADQLGRILSTTSKVTRYFASVNTQYNPIFGVVNILRDTQESLVNLSTTPIADRKTEVLKNTGSALLGIYADIRAHRKGQVPRSQWAQLFEEFQKEGGATGYKDMYATPAERAEALTDEIKKIQEGKVKEAGRAVLGWLSDYNEAMENAVRLSAYKAARDKGISAPEAASIAKNLTVNFNRKGTIATQAGALYAFFNASVQGTARIIETLKGPAGKSIIAGGLAFGVMQAFLMSAFGFKDGEPPDFIKDNNTIFPTGGGKYVMLPMPLGLRVLPTIGRRVTEWMMSGGRNTAHQAVGILGALADAFNPIGSAGISMQTLSPTVFDPLAALMENKDFAGRPIAREDFSSMKPTPGPSRARDTASGVGTAVSWMINRLSGGSDYTPGAFSPTPDQIDYLIGQVTGGVGREALKLATTVKTQTTGEELPPYKIPLVGRFYGDVTGQASQASKFYSNVKQLELLKEEIDGRRKHGEGATVPGFIRDHPEATLAPLAEASMRDLAAAKKQKKALIDRNASPDAIKVIESRITSIMQRLNDQMERRTAQ